MTRTAVTVGSREMAGELHVRRELLLCGGVAALLSLLVVSVVPPGGDLAAHMYRTFLVREGVWVWDNLWFAGQYPLFSYSLLYYVAASFVGNALLGIASIVAAVVLFGSLVLREWGSSARWPIRSFAVLATGQLFTAAYPFDAGVATLLATIWSLQRGRLVIAVVCAVLTLGFSPLAFLFLVLALAALWLRNRSVNRQTLILAFALLAAAGVEMAVLTLFPAGQLRYPYGLWRLVAGLALAGPSAALAMRVRRAQPLGLLFIVWAIASIVAYAIPSPIGHNIARASTFFFPLSLLAAALARFRPRWLALPVVIGALAATVVPYLSMIPVRASTVTSSATFWHPMLAFLAAHSGPDFRVEVVPTSNHWEAYYLPHAGYSLARGWYRQLDIADNPVLYRPSLTPVAYRAWLRHQGVKYVILPRAPLEAVDASREAALLRSGRSGLREVWSGRDGSIYAVSDPRPILTGPGHATITNLSSSRIVGRVSRPGTYVLRVHYTPYWQVGNGTVCIGQGGGRMTQLVFARAGRFSLRADESAGSLLAGLLDSDARHCRATARTAQALVPSSR